MQQSFLDNHVAMRLRGVNNPYAIIGKLNAAGTQTSSKGAEMTVSIWLTSLQAADGFTLFPKVLPCANGEIELWYNIIHAQEVKAWVTTALADIARLARLDTATDWKRAKELFAFPDKVQASIEKMKHEVSLPRARTAYLDFQPPVINTKAQLNTRNVGGISDNPTGIDGHHNLSSISTRSPKIRIKDSRCQGVHHASLRTVVTRSTHAQRRSSRSTQCHWKKQVRRQLLQMLSKQQTRFS